MKEVLNVKLIDQSSPPTNDREVGMSTHFSIICVHTLANLALV